MIRKDFIFMDDRLWTPEEWAVWLRYLVHTMSGRVENPHESRRYKTAVIEQKDSRFMKNDT